MAGSVAQSAPELVAMRICATYPTCSSYVYSAGSSSLANLPLAGSRLHNTLLIISQTVTMQFCAY